MDGNDFGKKPPLGDYSSMAELRSWPLTASSLLLRIRNPDDDEAWAEFVAVYTPLICRYCQKRGFQEADAREVAQEVMIVVIREASTFAYDRSSGKLCGWLGKLTRQAASRLLAKRTRDAAVATEEGLLKTIASEAEPEWIDEYNEHLFQTAIAAVRPEFRAEVWRAFELVWLNNEKPRDVALRLRRKPPWVYKAKFNVIDRLTAEILRLGADVGFLVKRSGNGGESDDGLPQ